MSDLYLMHQPALDQQHQHNGEERTAAPLRGAHWSPRAWAALTEYIHLWCQAAPADEESHIDLSTELLLEETADDIIP